MASKSSPIIAKAVAVLQELSADERARQIAESREKYRRDEEARRKDAIMLGERRGEKRTRMEMIQNMRQEGISLAQIAKISKVPLAEVKRLIKEPVLVDG